MSVKDFLFPSRSKRSANKTVPLKTARPAGDADRGPAQKKRPRNIGMVIRLDAETMLRTSVESEDK